MIKVYAYTYSYFSEVWSYLFNVCFFHLDLVFICDVDYCIQNAAWMLSLFFIDTLNATRQALNFYVMNILIFFPRILI